MTESEPAPQPAPQSSPAPGAPGAATPSDAFPARAGTTEQIAANLAAVRARIDAAAARAGRNVVLLSTVKYSTHR